MPDFPSFNGITGSCCISVMAYWISPWCIHNMHVWYIYTERILLPIKVWFVLKVWWDILTINLTTRDLLIRHLTAKWTYSQITVDDYDKILHWFTFGARSYIALLWQILSYHWFELRHYTTLPYINAYIRVWTRQIILQNWLQRQ